MRSFTVAIALFMLLPLTTQAAPGSVQFEEIIPADTDMVVLIDDVPRFLQRWSESPLGRAWDDPQIKQFLAPLREEMEIDHWQEVVRSGTGIELDQILGALNGEAALVVADLHEMLTASENESNDAMMALLVEVGEDDSIVRRLLELELESTREELDENEKLEEIKEEFQGETFNVRRKITAEGEEEREAWAIVDGIWVMGEPKSYLQTLVGALKQRSEAAPLKDNPGFRKMRKRVPATDMLIWVNADLLNPFLEEGLQGALDDPEAPNPLGTTSKAVLDALALDVLESAFASITLLDGATHIDMGVQYGEDRGLVKLLAFQPGPVRPPTFLPDDAIEAAAINFSVPQAWQAIKELLGAINPPIVGMLESQLAQLSSTHGFDLEKGVLGSLGDQLIAVKYLLPTEEPGETPTVEVLDELMGISISNRQSLEMGLEALKSMMGAGADLFETTEYLGSTIFTFKKPVPTPPGIPARRVAYTLTEDYLLFSVGTHRPLRASLSRMGQSGRTPWDIPRVKQAMKNLPPNASGFSYFDTETSLRALMERCDFLQNLMRDQEAPEEETLKICDPAAKPDPSVISKYFGPGVGAQYKYGGGFYSTTRLIHPSR